MNGGLTALTLPLWGVWAVAFAAMFLALLLEERVHEWRRRRRHR
jgi:hypothetical protein